VVEIFGVVVDVFRVEDVFRVVVDALEVEEVFLVTVEVFSVVDEGFALLVEGLSVELGVLWMEELLLLDVLVAKEALLDGVVIDELLLVVAATTLVDGETEFKPEDVEVETEKLVIELVGELVDIKVDMDELVVALMDDVVDELVALLS
jgi:hypothetical protein